MNPSLSLLLAALASFASVAPLAQAAENHGHDHGAHMAAMAHADAAGRPGDPAQVSRTIAITLNDTMHLTPSQIEVQAGETIRFFLRNAGKATHELVIGTRDALRAHAEMMRSMPDMKHAEPNMISLAPGQRGGIVWRFDQPGTVDFACLVPGHMEAGMAGTLIVK